MNERDVLKNKVNQLHHKQTELQSKLHPPESSKARIVFERVSRALNLDEGFHTTLLNYATYVFPCINLLQTVVNLPSP